MGLIEAEGQKLNCREGPSTGKNPTNSMCCRPEESRKSAVLHHNRPRIAISPYLSINCVIELWKLGYTLSSRFSGCCRCDLGFKLGGHNSMRELSDTELDIVSGGVTGEGVATAFRNGENTN